MSVLFIDTETKDLPPMKCRNFVNPKKFKQYSKARLIEVNWVIMNEEKEKVLKKTNKIDPDADTGNIKLIEVLKDLYNDLKENKIKKIVGYNILFHYHVIIAEAYRVKNGKLIGKLDIINHKPKTKPICSMKMAMIYMDIENLKFIGLNELYYLFFKKQTEGKKLMKNVKCFYKIKTLKKDKVLANKYSKKYIKYLKKLKNKL